MEETKIPTEVGDKLWLAFQPKSLSDEGMEEAANIVNYSPSLSEFKHHISTLNSRSAPGFSGLTYLMVKLWPESMVERAYECLTEAWKEKKGPLNEDECTWLEDNLIQSDPFDWDEWINRYSDNTYAARELIRIRKLLSAENRKEFRRIHGNRMQKIQEEADAGRIGGVIRNIMGGSSPYTMESIRQDGEVITDGERITKLITEFFPNGLLVSQPRLIEIKNLLNVSSKLTEQNGFS